MMKIKNMDMESALPLFMSEKEIGEMGNSLVGDENLVEIMTF